MDKETIIRKIVRQFSNVKGVAALFLYGSLASGQFRDESDVDVAVLFSHDTHPSALTMIEIKGELSSNLGRDVDVVNLNEAGALLAMQVIEKGEEIFVSDPKETELYKIRLFTDYSDMKDLLKPFEEKYFGERHA